VGGRKRAQPTAGGERVIPPPPRERKRGPQPSPTPSHERRGAPPLPKVKAVALGSSPITLVPSTADALRTLGVAGHACRPPRRASLCPRFLESIPERAQPSWLISRATMTSDLSHHRPLVPRARLKDPWHH